MRSIALWLAITGLLALAGGIVAGPLGAGVVVALSSGYLLLFVWLPRSAHRAFSRGEFRRARRLFRVAGWVRLTRSARRAAQLSICACELGAGRWREGLSAIETLTSATFAPGERAVWNNNIAYALARLEERTGEAVSFAEQALAARPSLPGFVHTQGIALLAAGRVDEAITALEAVYSDERDDDVLEAERCYDLGRAWLAKGETDYACDYFGRASRAAPESAWAARATDELGEHEAALVAPPTEGIV